MGGREKEKIYFQNMTRCQSRHTKETAAGAIDGAEGAEGADDGVCHSLAKRGYVYHTENTEPGSGCTVCCL